MFRPKDLKNPFGEGGYMSGVVNAEVKEYAWEAGADAMLEGLRGQGWRIITIRDDVIIPMTFPTQTKGWLVLIPDEGI